MLEINKEIELIQVLLFLSNTQEKTQQQLKNAYYTQAIKDFFGMFNNHEAVRLTRDFVVDHWFTHIKPLRAILYLEEIIENKYIEVIDNLKSELKISSDELRKWAVAVKRFELESRFDDFFTTQMPYYTMIIDKVKSWEYDKWIKFTESYFRCKSSKFNLYICPLNGNYGFLLDKPDSNTAYVIRCLPYYDIKGNMTWEKELFAKGVAHEFAHCFVNKVVEDNKELLSDFKPFFDRHLNMYKSYNVNYAIMNEYWVRAFAIRFMEIFKDSFPDFDISEEYLRQRESFIYIDAFVDMLKEFESTELTFSEFYLSNIANILTILEAY